MVAKKSVVFKNAIIDTAEGTITEITKDGENVFNLNEALAMKLWQSGMVLRVSPSIFPLLMSCWATRLDANGLL